MEERRLPEAIRERTGERPFQRDTVGMSGAEIRIYGDRVLKIARRRENNEETVRVLRWLEGKLPVPKVLCYERDAEYDYLLMSRVPGKMACDPELLEKPGALLKALAEALKLLWSVEIARCPRVRDPEAELREARYRVEKGLVDRENAEPSTFGEGGFRDPEELLRWLETHRPDYDPVLSHGDFCLPNLFLEDGRLSGLVDLGDTGVGDRWRDIALGWRSLKHNYDGTYGGKADPDFCPDALFDALGLAPDREKLRYYLLLDELF